jgi:hypothetical protein
MKKQERRPIAAAIKPHLAPAQGQSVRYSLPSLLYLIIAARQTSEDSDRHRAAADAHSLSITSFAPFHLPL